MPDLNSLSPQRLFKQWREGDAQAGQAMAQRFSDWYYAVTSSRLGDAHGRGPLQRACTRFQQGIISVTNPNDLVDWAHGILVEEVALAGSRIGGGDFPNRLTGDRPPSEILGRVRKHLTRTEVLILSHAYDPSFPIERVQQETLALGGMPLAVLQARYKLKRVLRDHAGVSLAEAPDEPNLDYAPMPLYEAGRMRTQAEETGFEKWILSNVALCRDIAEFAVFALALRNGAYADTQPEVDLAPPPPRAVVPEVAAPPAAPPPPAVEAPVVVTSRGDPQREVAPSRSPMMLVGALVAAVVVVGGLLAAVYWFLGHRG